jgi:hypothetical protein
MESMEDDRHVDAGEQSFGERRDVVELLQLVRAQSADDRRALEFVDAIAANEDPVELARSLLANAFQIPS